MSRRRVVLAWGLLALAACEAPTAVDDPYLLAASEVGRWLERVSIEDEHGRAWPVAPLASADTDDSLYAGNPGPVLFFLALHRATGDERSLQLAREGADRLVAGLEHPAGDTGFSAGLYTGLAGVAFTLDEVHRTTGDSRYRDAVERCVGELARRARSSDGGARWDDVRDVISGSAGVGFALLALDDPRADALARRVARGLLADAEPAEGGRRWRMTARRERDYPGFSHGTAGVAAFLAAVARRGGDDAPELLAAARDGARYLEALAEDDLVPHHLPGGEELFYLGWCHGPPGTVRLYRELELATGEPVWSERADAALRALRRTGAPAERTPGFWNNEGRCCGTAGVLEVWLDRYVTRGGETDLASARAAADLLLARADGSPGEVRWTHAEHRTRPEEVAAQTGLMQGAAGIGLALLRLSAALRGEPDPTPRFPDSPFAGPKR